MSESACPHEWILIGVHYEVGAVYEDLRCPRCGARTSILKRVVRKPQESAE